MNILVTGANGQLGTAIREASKGSSDRYIFSDVSQVGSCETLFLDITNIDAIRLVCESEGVDAIVNCAAYTAVDKAEDDVSMADLLNHKAPEYLARVAHERNAFMIHISTDYVLGGKSSTPYREDAPVQPLGVYGTTKEAGERKVREYLPESHIIFRTAWLYSPWGKNFVKTMMGLTGDRRELKVVFDQVGTPTYAPDLAELIVKVLSERMLDRPGTYNFTDEGAISWYDFACAIRDLCGHSSCKIYPCRSEEYPSKATRPAFSVLDKALVKKTFSVEIPHWYPSLEKCVERLKASSDR